MWQLKQESSALEELSRQLFLEAHEAREMQARIEWAKTWRGKYFNCLGYFFSIYCLWKIFIVSSFIFFITFDNSFKRKNIIKWTRLCSMKL